jgi:hypothetical protein
VVKTTLIGGKMGLLKSHIHIIAREHAQHPIKGEVLVLSQQMVFATLEEAKKILAMHGATVHELPDGFDTKNKVPGFDSGPNMIYCDPTNCQALMMLLGADKVYTCDVSNDENPDFLINLNLPIDRKYHNRFDTIVDSGTLEHVFDVPQALENINLMLKKGGTLILSAPTSNAVNHGFYSLSPTLFFDYYSTNGFENFDCYLTSRKVSAKSRQKVYKMPSNAITLFISMLGWADAVFLARKPDNYVLKNERNIIQSLYAGKAKFNPILDGRSKVQNTVFQNIMKHLKKHMRYSPDFLIGCYYEFSMKNVLEYIGEY